MSRILVGNLDFTAKSEQIRTLFEPHGAVSKVEIVTDWETGHSRGFAFVVFDDAPDAEAAIQELNGVEVDGRPLTVRLAPKIPPMGFSSLSDGR